MKKVTILGQRRDIEKVIDLVGECKNILEGEERISFDVYMNSKSDSFKVYEENLSELLKEVKELERLCKIALE